MKNKMNKMNPLSKNESKKIVGGNKQSKPSRISNTGQRDERISNTGQRDERNFQ